MIEHCCDAVKDSFWHLVHFIKNKNGVLTLIDAVENLFLDLLFVRAYSLDISVQGAMKDVVELACCSLLKHSFCDHIRHKILSCALRTLN